MKKIIIQASIALLVLVGVWLLVSSVDWMRVFGVEKIIQQAERKVGDVAWEIYGADKKELKNPILQSAVDSMFDRLCVANHLDRKKLNIHLVKDHEVNAFALPGNHIVINSGLLVEAKKPEEVCGVVGHEIAHLELSHVSKRVLKEMGIGLILAIVTSSDGTGAGAAKILEMLTSTAYDRSLEKEADIQATNYLIKAHIDPYPFADFLERLDTHQDSTVQFLSWISTHPDSKERATYIRGIIKKNNPNPSSPILNQKSWGKLKSYLRENEGLD